MFQGKKSFAIYSGKKDFNPLFEIISSKCDTANCLDSIKEITEIR